MKTVLITGANRGIGLALCKTYFAQGWKVIGVCRTASPELTESGARIIAGVDVTDPQALAQLADTLEGKPIDLLINNAGIFQHENLGAIDYNSIQQQFLINAEAPLRVTEAMLGNLNSGAKIAFITSRMGSIADNTSGGYYGYRMSKAALNAAAMSLARDLKPRGIAGDTPPGLCANGDGEFWWRYFCRRICPSSEPAHRWINTGKQWHFLAFKWRATALVKDPW